MSHVDIRFVTEAALGAWAIRRYTLSPWSHCGALWNAYEYGARNDAIRVQAYDRGRVVTFGKIPPGVATRPQDYAKFTKSETLRIDCTSEQDQLFWQFIDEQIGKPYDKFGILGMAADNDWHDPSAWFCSELMAAALEYAGILPSLGAGVWRVTPGALYTVLRAIGAVPV